MKVRRVLLTVLTTLRRGRGFAVGARCPDKTDMRFKPGDQEGYGVDTAMGCYSEQHTFFLGATCGPRSWPTDLLTRLEWWSCFLDGIRRPDQNWAIHANR